MTNRRKGSKDNVTLWSPRLKAAVEGAFELRSREWAKKTVLPFNAKDRPLFVVQDGGALSKSGLDSVWQRLVRATIRANVISEEERFGLHDLKRKGITDTPGTRGEKQLASGHRTEAMLDVYDKSIPAVRPAGG